MSRRRRVWTLSGALVGATLMVLTLAMTGSVIAQRPREGQAPKFQVDPWWPRPLPNNWLVGQVSGVAVDRHDHIWIVHRPRSLTEDERGATTNPPRSLCCVPAPPVLEFDAEGALVRSWGGPGAGYEWPLNEHGIFVDDQDNVWIGGNDAKDHQILKFTREGTPGRAGHARCRLGLGRRRFARRVADLALHRPTVRTITSGRWCATPARSSANSAATAARPASCTGCTIWR